jgi:hypothetical protein
MTTSTDESWRSVPTNRKNSKILETEQGVLGHGIGTDMREAGAVSAEQTEAVGRSPGTQRVSRCKRGIQRDRERGNHLPCCFGFPHAQSEPFPSKQVLRPSHATVLVLAAGAVYLLGGGGGGARPPKA